VMSPEPRTQDSHAVVPLNAHIWGAVLAVRSRTRVFKIMRLCYDSQR
jgi:hypothetical protein